MTAADIKEKIENGTLSGSDLADVLEAVVEIVMNNHETTELFADMAEEGEDVAINFAIPDMGEHSLVIAGGQISFTHEGAPDPTITITMDQDTAVGLISGKLDPLATFSAGLVKLEGNLTKAMSLILVLQVVGDYFGVEVSR
jgi:putative sterol carrier protein